MQRTIFTAFICGLTAVSVAQITLKADITTKLKLNQSRYDAFENGADLQKQADLQGSDVKRTIVASLSEGRCGDCPPADDANHWRVKQAADESDLVATGVVTQTVSALTQHKGFVFTDSQFKIDQIWKISSSLGIVPNDEVTVTTAGGSLTLDGHRITGNTNNTRLFTAGYRYLLFLKYLPDSKSFTPVGLFGFGITGPTVIPMQKNIDTPGRQYLDNLTSFLQAMHSSTEHAVEEDRR